MNARKLKGEQIAKTIQIQKKGLDKWIVPSQRGHGNYAVTMNMEGRNQFRKCTCLDYESSGHDCKHIYAVLYTEKLIAEQPDSSIGQKVSEKVYTQNWTAYNKS